MIEINNSALFEQELRKAEKNKVIIELTSIDDKIHTGQISGYAGSYLNNKDEMTKPAVAIMVSEGLIRFELSEIIKIRIEE